MAMKKFAVDKREFGETYHIGAAMLSDKDIEAYVVYDNPQDNLTKGQKCFLGYIAHKNVKNNRVNLIKREEYKKQSFDKLGDTTEIIVKNFDCDKIKKTFLENLNYQDIKEVISYLKKRVYMMIGQRCLYGFVM